MPLYPWLRSCYLLAAYLTANGAEEAGAPPASSVPLRQGPASKLQPPHPPPPSPHAPPKKIPAARSMKTRTCTSTAEGLPELMSIGRICKTTGLLDQWVQVESAKCACDRIRNYHRICYFYRRHRVTGLCLFWAVWCLMHDARELCQE